MKKYFIILLLAMVQLNSCQDKKYKDMNAEERAKVDEEILNRPSEIWPTNKDKNGDYYYKTSICSFPGYYSEDAGSHFVTDKESVGFLTMENSVWPRKTSSGLNDEYHPLPKKLYVAWFSSAENKFYEGLFDMPYDKIKEEFDKMWSTSAPYAIQQVSGKYERFTDIVVGVAPKGDVVVWISSGTQTLEIGRYKAKETTAITWQDFAAMNGMGEGATREYYLKNVTKSTFPLQVGKLEQYEKKYTWKPKIQNDNPVETNLFEMQMYNGESERIYHEFKGNNPYEKRAVPKFISFNWQIKPSSSYQIDIYFKEEDIYKAFNILGREDHSLDLVLDLDKESKLNKIYLSNGKEKFVLDPEKIKYYPSNGNDYDPKLQPIKE